MTEEKKKTYVCKVHGTTQQYTEAYAPDVGSGEYRKRVCTRCWYDLTFGKLDELEEANDVS